MSATGAVTYIVTLTGGFSPFVTAVAAPFASGWSGRRVGLAPPEKRRLSTAHTRRLPEAPFISPRSNNAAWREFPTEK
jgi:hypothetical protein